MSVWAIDDPTEEHEPLTCPDCHAIGDAPCERGCMYAEDPCDEATALGYMLADRAHDEDASSDADPPDPWADVF